MCPNIRQKRHYTRRTQDVPRRMPEDPQTFPSSPLQILDSDVEEENLPSQEGTSSNGDRDFNMELNNVENDGDNQIHNEPSFPETQVIGEMPEYLWNQFPNELQSQKDETGAPLYSTSPLRTPHCSPIKTLPPLIYRRTFIKSTQKLPRKAATKLVFTENKRNHGKVEKMKNRRKQKEDQINRLFYLLNDIRGRLEKMMSSLDQK